MRGGGSGLSGQIVGVGKGVVWCAIWPGCMCVWGGGARGGGSNCGLPPDVGGWYGNIVCVLGWGGLCLCVCVWGGGAVVQVQGLAEGGGWVHAKSGVRVLKCVIS